MNAAKRQMLKATAQPETASREMQGDLYVKIAVRFHHRTEARQQFFPLGRLGEPSQTYLNCKQRLRNARQRLDRAGAGPGPSPDRRHPTWRD